MSQKSDIWAVIDGWDELLVTKGFESVWFGHYLTGGWRPHASDE